MLYGQQINEIAFLHSSQPGPSAVILLKRQAYCMQ